MWHFKALNFLRFSKVHVNEQTKKDLHYRPTKYNPVVNPILQDKKVTPPQQHWRNLSTQLNFKWVVRVFKFIQEFAEPLNNLLLLPEEIYTKHILSWTQWSGFWILIFWNYTQQYFLLYQNIRILIEFWVDFKDVL